MKRLSQRSVFTAIMSLSATLFGGVAVVLRLGGQSDLIEDIIKIGLIIGIGTAILSFIFWTFAHYKKTSLWRSGLAGFLTAITIIPVPFFGAALRTEFKTLYQSDGAGFVASFLDALLPALKSGLFTFVDISKISLIAILASILVGLLVGYFIQPQPDEKRLGLQ